jgi:hypothetical protein
MSSAPIAGGPAAHHRRSGTVTLMLVVVLAGVPRVSGQTNLTFVPSVSTGTIYDDNLFAKIKGEAGAMTLVRPAVETIYGSPTLTFQSLFSFDMQHSNFAALSSLDARRHADFDIRHRTTPAATLGFGLRYDRTETPGDLNLETGILGDRHRAARWEFVPSLAYRLQPRTTLNGSYAVTTETLVDDIRGTLGVARAGVTRQASTRDDLTVSYLGRSFVDVFDTHRSNAVLIGWARELAHATRLTVQGGPRVSSGKGLDAEILAGFTRSTNRVRMSIDYWHGEAIILGIRGPVAVDTATARLVWPVTQRTELGLHTGVTDSNTLAEQNVRVYRAIALGAWTPRGGPYTLSASYGAEFQNGLIRRSVFFEESVVRQTIRVNLTIAPRLSRSFRPTGEPPVMRPQGVAQ